LGAVARVGSAAKGRGSANRGRFHRRAASPGRAEPAISSGDDYRAAPTAGSATSDQLRLGTEAQRS
jgi:hypothetical protein